MEKIDLHTIHPEPLQGHTSKGDQPKWHVDDKWYKADHMGYEALSEIVISRLLEKSNLKNFVRYDPVQIFCQNEHRVGCVSHSFQKKDDMLIPFERLHRAYFGKGLAETISRISEPTDQIRYTVDFVERVTGLTDVGPYLALLLELDAFFLNEDRHTNNLAVIRNEKTKAFRLCPVFDNGLALLSDLNDYPLDKNLYDCIAHVGAKPFSSDFDTQVEAAELLYKPQLKFFFDHSDVARILDELESIYAPTILERTERVIYEQMRKYRILF